VKLSRCVALVGRHPYVG